MGSDLLMIGTSAPDWAIALAVAPVVGSFAGVVIERLPYGKPFVFSRSECPSCAITLSWSDLIPVASYLALQGKCRRCQARIAPFHIGVECAALGIAVWAVAVAPDPLTMWLDCLLGWSLLVLAWIDVRHRRLPDALTLPLVVVGIVTQTTLSQERGIESVLGAMCGYASFWSVRFVYRILRGREGLGLGDAKLLAAAGAWTSWAALPHIVFIASILGILFALLNKYFHNRRLSASSEITFGPFIAFALFSVRLHGFY